MAYAQILKERIEEYLKEIEWDYSFHEDDGIFETSVRLDGKLNQCKMLISLHEDRYNTYAIFPLYTDKEHLQVVGEYLHRVNYGLQWAFFEMDYEDGEIRIKSFVDCGDNCDNPPSRSVIGNSINMPPSIIDVYGDRLLQVMFGYMTPEEAIAAEKVEKEMEDEENE